VLLGRSTLAGEKKITAREANPEPEGKKNATETVQEVLDVFDRLAGFLILACPCGVRIKVPEKYGKEMVPCTRCGRENRVPKASSGKEHGEHPTYRRTGSGWESFRCTCGRNLQLSPAFSGTAKKCTDCGRKITILHQG
jgi:hypothetical protein